MMLASMTAYAQDTYTNAEIATEDLNGTARYVAMGGALDALGADISTINTNPAGVGLFRRSQMSLSGSYITQQGVGSDADAASLDQGGFVWVNRMGINSYLNFGFNYKKTRNFAGVLDVDGCQLFGASQNANSYMNLMDANDLDDWNLSQLDALYYNTFVGDKDGNLYYNAGDAYWFNRHTSGSTASYDLNISGNVSDRVYLGLTMGITSVQYDSYTNYYESLLNGKDENIGEIGVVDHRNISGAGYNFKLGAIFFPIEESAFRVGLSIATPTWYDLRTCNWTYLENNAQTGGTPHNPNFQAKGDYDYKLFTPWKFGISAGHTIDNFIALGASIDYAGYGSMKNRILDSGYYHEGYAPSSNDTEMNDHTKATLKGVTTLKLGTEVKITPQWAARLGYNFVSPMYKKDGFRDCTVWSPGTYYSSATDYTNWKATHRITAGFGFNTKHFNFDIACQMSTTKGEFSPFMSSSATYEWSDGYVETVDNQVNPVNVSCTRTQLLGTITYKF